MTPLTPRHLPRILVVDDTPENLQVLAEILARYLPCDLSFATDGYQAIDSVKTDPPDLILLDIMMPGMSGFDVCNQLKHTPETIAIPIIFLTAKTEPEDIATGFNLGAADYVTKPFNATELVARIKTHLSIRDSIRLIADKNKELRQMLHILCHDLANPIGSILSLLEMLDDPSDPDPETIAMMRQMAGSALELIGIVRQIRGIEDRKIRFKLESIPLHRACRGVQNILQTRLNDKQLLLELNVPEGLNVLAEPVALTHTVLCNLLTNAAKFSERGSTITIQADAQPDNRIHCTITDTGIGIPFDLLQNLFDSTTQTSRTGTANEQGTGFGMPLVKCIIESFGGTIEIESRDIETHPENHGTSIHLYLQAPQA